MWFFSADLHLGHTNIIKYCKRPFMSYEEEGLYDLASKNLIPERDIRISQQSTDLMTNTIIDNINAVVKPDDSFVILGDFCWTPKNNRFQIAKAFRDRINCKNVYLIWGNHDDQVLKPLFLKTFEQYCFNINGQSIFTSHYPCRSWDKAFHGSWMLYGHVHNMFGPQDNGDLMPYDKKVLKEGFESVLNRHFTIYGVPGGTFDPTIVDDLLAVCASLNGIDYTLDVGVDNDVRGPGVPFGTPWSFDEIKAYMDKKKTRWEMRMAKT